MSAFETGPRCPSTDRLWEAATRGVPAQEARDLLDHAAGCNACAGAWALALAISREAGLTRPSGTHRWQQPAWRSWYVWLPALAAAAVLVIGVFIDYRHLLVGRVGDSNWRGAAPAADIKTLVPDNGSLPREAFVLRWSSDPPGVTYRVRVLTADLRLIDSADNVTVPEYRVAPASLSRVPVGARVMWQVEAVTADGRRLTSPSFFVRLQ